MLSIARPGLLAAGSAEFSFGLCPPDDPCTIWGMVRTLHLERWAGRWVAIDLDDQVQCDAALLDDLMVLVHQTGRDDLTVLRAPHPDEPLMFGLG